jgi:rhodanese-related sulfurtransferase
MPPEGKTMFRERVKQCLWQVPLMIVLAGLVALGVNRWRPDGIPLRGDWSTAARFGGAAGDSLTIALDQASALFQQDAAVFLDARPEMQYSEGHIRGALNLPWREVDRYFLELAERLAAAPTIITYCDGENCDLSHELALFLKEMGYENVRVLVNGWTLWQQAGLPVSAGA